MSKSTTRFFLVLVLILAIGLGGIHGYRGWVQSRDLRIGIELLYAMYDFNPIALAAQDAALEAILSPELFRLYSLSFDQRQLHAYLRFQNAMATPHIIHIEPGRIVYWIETSNISPLRTFQIEYRHRGGRVVSISETELFFLPPSGRDFWE